MDRKTAKRHRFPKRAKQAKTAVRGIGKKKHRAAKPTQPEFVIVPKKGPAGSFLADPIKMINPALVTDVGEAKILHGRSSAHKFLSRLPRLKKIFSYQRVA
jgi:hypothetical protein